MPNKPWKDVERKFARFFGTERNSLSGSGSKVSESDTIHPVLFMEVKMRKSFAISDWYRQAAASAKKEGKIPLLGLKEKGKRDWMICCDVRDLIKVAMEKELTKEELDYVRKKIAPTYPDNF